MMERAFFASCLLIAGLASCGFSDDHPEVPGVYGACDFAAECPREAEQCIDIRLPSGEFFVVGAICTVECESSDDCPDNGTCAAFDSELPELLSCQRTCQSQADCEGSYACRARDSVDLGTVMMCVPVCFEGGRPADPPC